MRELNVNKQQTISALSVLSVERDNGNGKRLSIIIQNTSLLGEKVAIGIDGEAALGTGIVLSAGGSWSDSYDGSYLPTQKIITAIASAATATVSIQERVGI